MRLTFSKLVTIKPQVEVKADNYKSIFYDVNTAKTSGIVLNPTVYTSLDTISIGNPRLKLSPTAEQKTAFLELVASASYPTVSLSNLYTYLSEKENNTVETPYKIALTDVPSKTTGGQPAYPVEGTIQYALVKGSNANKYVDIVLPSSVTSIGQNAFWKCTSLTTINYTGTEEQWDAITKGSNWNYWVPSSTCTINYNYQV